MSDTVKLIIEIPKEIYERCKEYKLWSYDAETLEGAVATSKPLSEVVADVKADIRTCEIRHDFRIAEKDTKSRELMHGIFSDVYGVLARIGKTESEDK